MPTHSHSVLKEYLQGIGKQEEIELYYELLSSGHSVGEILESLGHLQGKSEHGNITTAEHPSSRVDRAAPEVTSEAALTGGALVNAQCIPGLTAPVGAESAGTEVSRIDEIESGDRVNLPDKNFPGSESDIVGSAAVHTSLDSEITVSPDSPKLRQPGNFSIGTKQFAIGALYTMVVASVSIASFAYLSGGPSTDPVTTRVQTGYSSGTKATATPALADASATIDEGLKATKQFANADNSPLPESPRSAAPSSGVPHPLQNEMAKISITFPESTSHIEPMVEPDRQVKASEITNHNTIGSGTGRSRGVSVPMGQEIGGEQIVRAFYTALERGDGQAASLLVIPKKREAGPFSARELSRFYGQMELPLRLLGVDRAGENLYNVVYTYKVRNGQFCNGRSLVRTVSLQNKVMIEGIRSPSRC